MRKWFVSLSLACGSLALVNAGFAQAQNVPDPVPPVQAKPIQIQVQVAPQPIQIQPVFQGRADMIMPGGPRIIGGSSMTKADAVFAGRVIAIEPMDVEAPQVNKGPMVKYRIAVVQISDSIFGLKADTKQVRIGFIVPQNGLPQPGIGGGFVPAPPNGNPAIQPLPPQLARRPFIGNVEMQLQVGQDGLFIVNKHHKENFFLSPNYQNFVTRENNPAFDTQVKTAKLLATVMGDPVKGLKAEDRQDRFTAAAVLISKYRMPTNPTGQPMKQEAIDAEESKLILKALAEGEWKQGIQFGAPIPSAFELFNQLGIQPKDGYNPINVRTQQDIFTAMQKFLDEKKDTYRIQKFVVDPNAPVPQPVPVPNPPFPIRPGIRPLPPVKVLPGGVLPAPVPQPAPIEIELPAQPAQPALPVPPVRQEK